ncbi:MULTISPECIES: copper resistance CopC family protein [Paenibacillus]|uniref:Copper resistance protein CopC n=2 Tax=Paenibacillus TaxID=44249 RepID=A0A7Y6BVC6_9BACL|nr:MULTISPECIES: copper resistance CopC family protein [Paenibacillus]MDN4603814.1 copper resistance protein CopC [Paenibacillus vandeheii]NUU75687.1 copper resistance protein CopC [Paenibacillus xylanilyticus]
MNIRKSTILLALIISFSFLFLFPSNSYAHTKLESSSPKVGEVVTTNLDVITLQFNTKIEVLSSFKLLDEREKEVPLDSTEIKDNTMIRHISTGSSLENGNYTIKWKIVGKDGHPIEGDYPFQVNLPIQPPVSDEIATNDMTPNNPQTTPEFTSTAPSEGEELTQNSSNSNALWYFAIGLAVILIIIDLSRRFVRRRKS